MGGAEDTNRSMMADEDYFQQNAFRHTYYLLLVVLSIIVVLVLLNRSTRQSFLFLPPTVIVVIATWARRSGFTFCLLETSNLAKTTTRTLIF